MNIRSRGSIAVFLISCVFFLFVFAASTVRADAGEGAGDGSPAAPGPSVIVVGAGSDSGGGDTEPDPGEDGGEDPGDSEDPEPGDGPSPEPSETTLDEKDGEGVVALPSPEDVSPSGAAAWHIPVRVPPGRNGIAPDLFLSYDGQGRAGIAGEGWNVEPGSVRRSMKRGVDYGAREFVVSGARGSGELVPREADWGTGFYGAKIEEAFVKYRYDGSA